MATFSSRRLIKIPTRASCSEPWKKLEGRNLQWKLSFVRTQRELDLAVVRRSSPAWAVCRWSGLRSKTSPISSLRSMGTKFARSPRKLRVASIDGYMPTETGANPISEVLPAIHPNCDAAPYAFPRLRVTAHSKMLSHCRPRVQLSEDPENRAGIILFDESEFASK